MRICEYAPEFQRQDPNDSTICFGEVDVYARDPTVRLGQNHRLSIRRRWTPPGWVSRGFFSGSGAPGEWELYRYYYVGQTARGSPHVEVIARGTLAQVCEAANAEWARAWGQTGSHLNDEPCDHGEHRASRCYAVDREALHLERAAEDHENGAEEC